MFLVVFLCRSIYIMFFVIFFFFKQKTEYEMRISDWSSDVCSSDLVDRGLNGIVHGVVNNRLLDAFRIHARLAVQPLIALDGIGVVFGKQRHPQPASVQDRTSVV